MTKKAQTKKITEETKPVKVEKATIKEVKVDSKGFVELIGTGKYALKKDKVYKAGIDLAKVLVKKGAANYK